MYGQIPTGLRSEEFAWNWDAWHTFCHKREIGALDTYRTGFGYIMVIRSCTLDGDRQAAIPHKMATYVAEAALSSPASPGFPYINYDN